MRQQCGSFGRRVAHDRAVLDVYLTAEVAHGSAGSRVVVVEGGVHDGRPGGRKIGVGCRGPSVRVRVVVAESGTLHARVEACVEPAAVQGAIVHERGTGYEQGAAGDPAASALSLVGNELAVQNLRAFGAEECTAAFIDRAVAD